MKTADVLKVRCQSCGAKPGDPCTSIDRGKRRDLPRPHLDRKHAAYARGAR